MKDNFGAYDIVKLNGNHPVVAKNQHAIDYIGIVKEVGPIASYIEWYDAKSKDSTREVTNLTGWINNEDLTRQGSLFHLVCGTNQLIVPSIAPVKVKAEKKEKKEIVAPTPEVRVKRKYVRKAGAAKPGPKPKKKIDVVEEVDETAVTPKGPVYVDWPTNNWGRPFRFKGNEYYNKTKIIATGKFKNFATREAIKTAIVSGGYCYYPHVNQVLDIAIVGEAAGPSKLEKFKKYCTSTMNEDQLLALLKAPGYFFNQNTIPDDYKKDYTVSA